MKNNNILIYKYNNNAPNKIIKINKLKDMSEDGSIYLKKGYKEKSLSRSKKWHFIPSPSVNVFLF